MMLCTSSLDRTVHLPRLLSSVNIAHTSQCSKAHAIKHPKPAKPLHLVEVQTAARVLE